ncbi:MAG TPA: DNA primase, partial [Ardenticatenaceae bacterium]|nr:DNA primase [Ardenticatenaceae bacterium]
EAATAARARLERLRELMAAAAQQFNEWLLSAPDAAHCRAYLARRGVRDETIRQFQLGYASNSWERLALTLGPSGRGYNLNDLASTGLIKERDTGGWYDTFRDRLMFPIRDVRGRVIGFGGRALADEQVPKYLNSPQTELFDKGKTLYALDLAREEIRRQDLAVIVEGYMDVIAAHQAGFKNVVASLGTALTPDQIKLLKRFTQNLTLALDADTAGSEATRRGVATAREALDRRPVAVLRGQGLLRREYQLVGELRILALPAGYDPDELIQEDPARWGRLVAEAKPVVDYLFEATLDGLNLDNPRDKAQAARELLPVIAELGDVVVRNHYLQRLSRLLRVDERTLASEMVALARPAPTRGRAATTRPPMPPVPEGPPSDDEFFPEDDGFAQGAMVPPGGATPEQDRSPRQMGAEEWLLFLLLRRPASLGAVEEQLEPDDFQSTANRELFEALRRHRPRQEFSLEEFSDELEPTLASVLGEIVEAHERGPALPEGMLEAELRDAVDKVKLAAEQTSARQLHFLIDDIQRGGPDADRNELKRLLEEYTRVSQQIVRRQRALFARTEEARRQVVL